MLAHAAARGIAEHIEDQYFLLGLAARQLCVNPLQRDQRIGIVEIAADGNEVRFFVFEMGRLADEEEHDAILFAQESTKSRMAISITDFCVGWAFAALLSRGTASLSSMTWEAGKFMGGGRTVAQDAGAAARIAAFIQILGTAIVDHVEHQIVVDADQQSARGNGSLERNGFLVSFLGGSFFVLSLGGMTLVSGGVGSESPEPFLSPGGGFSPLPPFPLWAVCLVESGVVVTAL